MDRRTDLLHLLQYLVSRCTVTKIRDSVPSPIIAITPATTGMRSA